ncbi:hypothetical protein Patl1_28729 [Pistacia atlantica]|uniref:Uncharacterized protein n=1 Tax=Pistacia atlantica TaxID=434234 RepID=A0ACC1BC00_9ROSI|nr:hypothetical protein Patl1_28729 [Pistacia atlantica]
MECNCTNLNYYIQYTEFVYGMQSIHLSSHSIKHHNFN